MATTSRLRAAFIAVALLAPMGASAQQFEGVISMRVNNRGASQNVDYIASRSGKARINISTPQGPFAVIVSPAEKKMFFLVESQAMYVEQDLAAVLDQTTNTASDATVVRTGRKETVAGTECEILKVDDLDVCAAKGLGTFLFGGAAMRGQLPSWQKELLDEGFFPLRVTHEGNVQMEATRIERKAVDARLFDVPGNFTRMQLPGRGG